MAPSSSGRSSSLPASAIPNGATSSGARHHRDGEPAAAGEQRAGALGEHDVGGPQRARGEREGDAGRVERAAAVVGEQHDPEPPRAPPTAGRAARREPADGDAERADELERHRDAERDPVHRLVDAEVHRAEREPEGDRDADVATRAPAQPRPPDRDEDQRGEREPPERGARRPELVEQLDRERRADLQRGDGEQDEPDAGRTPRPGPPALRGVLRYRSSRIARAVPDALAELAWSCASRRLVDAAGRSLRSSVHSDASPQPRVAQRVLGRDEQRAAGAAAPRARVRVEECRSRSPRGRRSPTTPSSSSATSSPP